MRIQRLLAVPLLAFSMVLLMPVAAHASAKQGEIAECLSKAAEKYEGHGDTKAAAKKAAALFDEEAKECYSAPSPILPAIGEVFWGSLSFAVVAFGLMKFGFPALRKGLADREAKIRGDLEAAEQAKNAAQAADSDHEKILAEARAEGAGLVDDARKAAEQVRVDLIARAEADAADIRTRANADASLATERAMAELQTQVAAMSIGLAERIVGHNLDAATQTALVESFINEVGGSRA